MRLIRARDLGRQKTIDPYLAEGLVRNALMQGRHALGGLDELQRTSGFFSDTDILDAVRRGDWLLVPNDTMPASGSLLSPAQPTTEQAYIFEDVWPEPKPRTDKVFAKSCTPGNWGKTRPGTAIEPASHFGKVMIAGTVALPASAITAANAGADTALARIAGGGIMQQGYTWALRGAPFAVNPVSLFILGMLPTTLGDGTLHQSDELRGMDYAPTRVRFQFRRDASGALQVYGIHTGPDGDDAVRTIKAEWNADHSALEAHLNGLTILWIPNKGPHNIPPLIYPDHPGEQLDTIRVHPIAENTDTEIEGYPAGEDLTTDDFILTFPAETGLRSLYIVYAKPAVRPLEVGPAGELQSRSKKDGLDIDHIPAQKALEAALQNAFLDDMPRSEIERYLRQAAGIAIPARVHQKYSETYGGRNTREKQVQDASNLQAAVDSNFDAIKPGLLEEGYAENDIEAARDQLHKLNQEQGWY